MAEEAMKPAAEEPKFKWEVAHWSKAPYKIDIRLHKNNAMPSIGEFSFSIRQMKKLDPQIYGYHVNDEYPYPIPEFLEHLRTLDRDGAKLAVQAMETKPSTVAYVGMWQINDEARGNLSVLRQMFKLALKEFKKYDVEYFVGKYVPQSGEGLSVAPYTEEMYKKLAKITGGEVHSDGNFWISVAGLEKWLGKSAG